MAMKRDEQGRLVITKVIDGKEVVTKVIPKHEEALYLRRGTLAGDANKDFPAKAEADKAQEMDRPYDVHRIWNGGDVQTFDELHKERPDHPEARIPEKLERVDVKVDTGQTAAEEYPLMGVNFDPGEVVEDEPVEEQK